MAHISTIGTGNMGQAKSSAVTQAANTVEALGESDTDTPVTGDRRLRHRHLKRVGQR